MITNTQNMFSKSALSFFVSECAKLFWYQTEHFVIITHFGTRDCQPEQVDLWTCIKSLCSVHPTFLLGKTRCIAEKICWFHGAIKFSNPKDSVRVLVHTDYNAFNNFNLQTAIAKNNPKKYLRSVGDGETVEFDVVSGAKVCNLS